MTIHTILYVRDIESINQQKPRKLFWVSSNNGRKLDIRKKKDEIHARKDIGKWL